MDNKTVINSDAVSNATQINDATAGVFASGTVVNSVLFNMSQIPIGTVLCDKYQVTAQMNVVSGEASLFICEYAGQKYVAKLYRRDVAIV